MKSTIKQLVLETFAHNPNISTDDLIRIVKERSPESAFNSKHVSWYKHHIFKEGGRYRLEYLKTVRSIGKSTKPHGEKYSVSYNCFRGDLLALKGDYCQHFKFKFETDLDNRNSRNPYKAYIIMFISRRATDEKVVSVGREILARYPDNDSLRKAKKSELCHILKPVGIQDEKAESLISNAKIISEYYNNQMPRDKKQLKKLKGVGDKIAACIMCYGFRQPDIPLDSHGRRIINRCLHGNSTGNELSENEVRKLLQEWFKEEHWIDIHELLKLHGRVVCESRNPKCCNCPIKSCRSRKARFRKHIIKDEILKVEQVWNSWRALLVD